MQNTLSHFLSATAMDPKTSIFFHKITAVTECSPARVATSQAGVLWKNTAAYIDSITQKKDNKLEGFNVSESSEKTVDAGLEKGIEKGIKLDPLNPEPFIIFKIFKK